MVLAERSAPSFFPINKTVLRNLLLIGGVMFNSKNIDKSNFVKVKLLKNVKIMTETLTRMGFGSKTEKRLTQVCYILKMDSDWYILHYKEFNVIFGKEVELSDTDLIIRNGIASLLQNWNYIEILNKDNMFKSYGLETVEDLSRFFVIKNHEKTEYEIVRPIDIVEINNMFKNTVRIEAKNG